MTPKLTMAIPTYNRLPKLKQCVKEVLKQIEGKNIELIISDNASSDGTFEWMTELLTVYPQVRYIKNEENLGPDKNFLNCYNLAKGEYTFLLSDDDILLPGAINSILHTLVNNPVIVHMNSCGLVENEDKTELTPARFEDKGIIFYEDKNRFLEDIGIRITFVSSMIVKTGLIRQIKNKEQYIGSYFLQSHLAILTMEEDGIYALNTYNCVAATPNITINYDLYFVWFECLKKLIIDTGMQSGFDGKMLHRLYERELKKTVFIFVTSFRVRCADEKKWNRSYVDRNLKHSNKLRVKFWFATRSPIWGLRIFNRVIAFTRKIKSLIRKKIWLIR